MESKRDPGFFRGFMKGSRSSPSQNPLVKKQGDKVQFLS